jgi:hypothetical protein
VNDYAYNGHGESTSLDQQGAAGGYTVAENRVDFTYNLAGRLGRDRPLRRPGPDVVTASRFTSPRTLPASQELATPVL